VTDREIPYTCVSLENYRHGRRTLAQSEKAFSNLDNERSLILAIQANAAATLALAAVTATNVAEGGDDYEAWLSEVSVMPPSRVRDEQVSPTAPESLGRWLRALPDHTILKARPERGPRTTFQTARDIPGSTGPVLLAVGSDTHMDLLSRVVLEGIAEHMAPLTIVELGPAATD
jgi:hypothetical protein